MFALLIVPYALADSIALSSTQEGDLRFSEVMVAPASALWYRGEWVEIENTTAYTIDLDGLILATDEDEVEVIGELLLEPGALAVLATRSSSSVNGGNTEVDYQYSVNELTIRDQAGTLSIGYDSVVFDSLDFPDPTDGAAYARDSYDGTWCDAREPYGDGDYGSPGEANPPCVDTAAQLSAGDLVVSELMVVPNATKWYQGQWFEVQNTTGSEVSLLGLSVSDSDGGSIAVDSDVRISAGQPALLAVRSSSSLNGGLPGVDVLYSTNDLTLSWTDSLTLEGDEVLDSVSWSRSELTAGAAHARSPLGATWCAATTVFGDGDYGSPAEANPSCDDDDADADGFTADDDCDDSDNSIYPGATEVSRDGIDQDCSGADLCAAPDSVVTTAYYADLLDICDSYPDGVSLGTLSVWRATETTLTDMRDFWCVCELDHLRVEKSPYVTSLDGLENLRVLGYLELGGTLALSSISGLSGLEVLHWAYIGETALSGLDGLQGITAMQSLTLSDRDLGNLQGLNNVETLDKLIVSKDETLDSFEGLDALTEISDTLWIGGDAIADDFSGLEQLESIGYLYVYAQDMESFEGLDNLQTIEWLQLGGAPTTSAGTDSLIHIGSASIANYEGDLDFFDNVETIERALSIGYTTIVDDDPFPSLVSIGEDFSAVATDVTAIGLDRLESVGDLDLSMDGVTSIDGLSSLTEVNGTLYMDIDTLEELTGLHSLEAITGSLFVSGNALTTIDGFSSLESIGGGFEVLGNPLLESLSGFDHLNSIGDGVNISNNPTLPDDEVKTLLEAIGYSNIIGDITVEDNGG